MSDEPRTAADESGSSGLTASPAGFTAPNQALLESLRKVKQIQSGMGAVAYDPLSDERLREARDGGMYGIDHSE